jgi:hypothetical protein
MDRSAPGSYTWVGIMSPCIAGAIRRCFALSRFTCAKLRDQSSEIGCQKSEVRCQKLA